MDKHQITERPLIDTALASLRKLGIDAEVARQQPKLGRAQADALIRVRHGDHEILYAAKVKRGLRPAILVAVLQQLEPLGEHGLLVTDYVTPPIADTLRARRVAFIDTAGNLPGPTTSVGLDQGAAPDGPKRTAANGPGFPAKGPAGDLCVAMSP